MKLEKLCYQINTIENIKDLQRIPFNHLEDNGQKIFDGTCQKLCVKSLTTLRTTDNVRNQVEGRLGRNYGGDRSP